MALVVAVTASLLGAGIVAPAQAAGGRDSHRWSGEVSGAYAGGYVRRDGNKVEVTMNLIDRRIGNGRCAYVRITPEIQVAFKSVWVASDKARGKMVRACDELWVRGKATFDLDNDLYPWESAITSSTRILVQVCEDIPRRTDVCDNFRTPPKDY